MSRYNFIFNRETAWPGLDLMLVDWMTFKFNNANKGLDRLLCLVCTLPYVHVYYWVYYLLLMVYPLFVTGIRGIISQNFSGDMQRGLGLAICWVRYLGWAYLRVVLPCSTQTYAMLIWYLVAIWQLAGRFGMKGGWMLSAGTTQVLLPVHWSINSLFLSAAGSWGLDSELLHPVVR